MNPSTTPSPNQAPTPPHSRKNPFLAELIGHERLTGPNSGKDTRHFVLSLAGSGLKYTPGDSLGAFGRNSPGLIDELLAWLEFEGNAPVKSPAGTPTTLRRALLEDYIVNRANRKVMTGLAQRIPQGEQRNRLMELVDNPELLSEYIDTRDYVDILKDFDEASFESPEAFLAQLTPVVPRLYSIASSPDAHPGEVHLCVAVVRYDTHGRAKKGLASGFLADHADMFVKNIPVYIQESRTFRLPQNRSADIIMCGPGAGIAPFRAFVEQRVLEGATGRNWLFFGEQRRSCDFLYGPEWLNFQKQGKLHRLDLAFSRDQDHKIYVQHRMKEQARELWDWLQNGAYFYVCGDAKHMAKDVHQTLIEIAQSEGGLSPEAAAEFVNVTLMRTEKRYLRDVY
ncbi:MAG TPA: sulfite reductase subunit alpha [Candidatus Dormibacteraeota bacterium]|nr:sulfite reductase subunit alpha [Candidatus Dormibacteraeota bacterium]